jgi:hypothetical protein
MSETWKKLIPNTCCIMQEVYYITQIFNADAPGMLHIK